jgi:hypothetical protein
MNARGYSRVRASGAGSFDAALLVGHDNTTVAGSRQLVAAIVYKQSSPSVDRLLAQPP